LNLSWVFCCIEVPGCGGCWLFKGVVAQVFWILNCDWTIGKLRIIPRRLHTWLQKFILSPYDIHRQNLSIIQADNPRNYHLFRHFSSRFYWNWYSHLCLHNIHLYVDGSLVKRPRWNALINIQILVACYIHITLAHYFNFIAFNSTSFNARNRFTKINRHYLTIRREKFSLKS